VLREGVALAPLSHIRIGGSACVFVEPWSEEDAAAVVRVCLEHGLPWRVLGGGSNILVADEGIDAVVIYLGGWNRVERDGRNLIASAGASLPSLLRRSRETKLSGLEGLIGIPAQVGGAVAMNAGTHVTETFDRIVQLRVIDEFGELRELERDALRPSYRNGNLGDVVVTRATFELEDERPAEVDERMKELLLRRNASQPVTQRSVGCIFKNPEEEAAGALIQAAGLMGERVGDIEVSTKHANYFVNTGHGTARQLLDLVERVQERVRDHAGVELELEVQLWGF
jgi:UDP-N-acetylmuramate dehydrogenase